MDEKFTLEQIIDGVFGTYDCETIEEFETEHLARMNTEQIVNLLNDDINFHSNIFFKINERQGGYNSNELHEDIEVIGRLYFEGKEFQIVIESQYDPDNSRTVEEMYNDCEAYSKEVGEMIIVGRKQMKGREKILDDSIRDEDCDGIGEVSHDIFSILN